MTGGRVTGLKIGDLRVFSDELVPRGEAHFHGSTKFINPVDYAKLKAELSAPRVGRGIVAASWDPDPTADAVEVAAQWHLPPQRGNVVEYRLPDRLKPTPPERFVTFLDRDERACEFGTEAGDRRDRTHIRHADMCRIECGMRESEVRKYEDYRPGMVNAVIAEQLKAGGVDTEGTRAQADRWLAMVCGCVCDGLRATTRDSAWRNTPIEVWHDADGKQRIRRGDWGASGKPLGRP